ncbi:AbfB domain-containing protein [Mangrovihabitans endophyticus]|uniref:Alpha-L-arabinofuranosidase B arabinose-binding domain-containing protein n=1 Tax=Mangrovihabitans endophyticus TaxID=1751298 RepID=A0A8J3BZ07_9ACTN|nr:AbfB domain-containing protein [Mangrovihabitans endophyticus]GGK91682.1 hypothetical protein GCM10012284_26970 [Mangrovihabitans endophyticus]
MTDQGPPPSGTVYGRGGVDVREPRAGWLTRTHPAVTAGTGAAIVAVMALGYAVWRANVDPPAPAVAASAPASAPAASPAPSPSPSPRRLTTGSWVLAAADDPDTRLTRDGDFAAMSSDGEPQVLTVSAGLADDACFSFATGGGEYLRHFDYRLRFDAPDGSDLFRKDATFCPLDDADSGTVRLRSTNYPGHVIHRRDGGLYIDEPDGTDTFTDRSSFAVATPPG